MNSFFLRTGLDMVVRDDNGNILDINQTSTTQLYEHHVQATNRICRATVSLQIKFLSLLYQKSFYTFTLRFTLI